MRILVYKRTHCDDPDLAGRFGAFDCMGMIRDRNYDAVIGVGGIGPEAQSNGIAGKINWVGIGPHKKYVGKRGPEVTFDHFHDFGTGGPDFCVDAPTLAKRMYANNVRSVLQGLTPQELAVATAIVMLAAGKPPSPGRQVTARRPKSLRSCRLPSPTGGA